MPVPKPDSMSLQVGREIAQLVKTLGFYVTAGVWGDSSIGYGAGLVTLGTGVQISVIAITFICAAIHFHVGYNL